jgi:hypothetical protein
VTTTDGFNAPVRCVGGADEHGVRGFRWPARHVGSAKIAGVKLRPRDLDDAIDTAGAMGRRVKFLPAR